MKIIYTINATYNSGGMEKVLCSKANFLCEKKGHEVIIITTEQKGRNSFFEFSPKIRFVDLGINYDDSNGKSFFSRFLLTLKKKQKHYHRLKNLLIQEKADICISMFDRDFDFLYKIKDGSKKILEYHFCKKMKVIEQQNIILKVVQSVRVFFWKYIVTKYDKFVVLTEEDRQSWGRVKNSTVIPNSIPAIPEYSSDLNAKNVLCIGRVSYQKGFDLLIEAWKYVNKQNPDWKLTIVGNGDKTDLIRRSSELGIRDSIQFKPASKNIEYEYLNSSIYVMSSRYEGLPMVLLESISYGLPIVSFSCPCGPKDIIDAKSGILVDCYNVEKLGNAINYLIENNVLRAQMGVAAKSKSIQYLENRILNRWDKLFNELLNNV